MPCSASEIPQYEVTHKEIELAAYYRFIHRIRQGIPGSPDSDWKQAQAELTAA